MTLNKRIRIAAVFILIVPLFAILITSSVFFITWSLGWENAEDLSVPRFLHAPLLSALRGDEVQNSKFAGIFLALDDKGHIAYIAPRAREEMDNQQWHSIDEAYTDIMSSIPNIPMNIAVYTYKGKSGLVFYLEEFFSGRKLFKANTLIIFSMYFGLIVLPIIIFSINSRPIMRSLVILETAAHEIGRGNLDYPVSVKGRQKKSGPHVRELDSLIQAFEDMRIELKENHENQGRIMMAISHDLKTPLTLIKGYVEALKDGMAETPEQVLEYAGVILDRSMLLEERINDLIYFARLRTSDWQTRFEEFSLGHMIDEAAEIFRNDSLIRKRKYYYRSELTADKMIRGDRKLLFQVFENLFDNACRYTLENDHIEIKAGLTGDLARITVEDSGAGIGVEHIEHIFDSFYRADSGRNTRGIGIGLTSAKTIIENHGGNIRYEASPLGGAGFIVELPVKTKAEPGGTV
jgi:signal transduction histidine kinase